MRLPERLWRRSACSNKSVSVTLQMDGSIDRIFGGGLGAGTLGAYIRSRIWPMRPRESAQSSQRAFGNPSNSARTSGHHSRGLRARYGDVQVGESNLFEESFKEPRFNGWTIGEIHVLDRRIVPNARRDNFEVNHHYSNLLVQLGPVAANISQHCRSASVSRNAAQIVQNTIAEVSTRLKQKRIDRAERSRLKSSVLRARSKAKAIVDDRTRSKAEAKLDRLSSALQKATSKRGASAVALDEAARLISRMVTNREQAKKLIDALRRLAG